jgi:hypothetical protein
MAHDIEHLKREIDALEKQISSHPFEGLFDRKRMDQLQDKLKKKRKELARLEHGDEHDDLETGADHIGIPEFIAPIEETPDLGPDFPLGIDAEDVPRKKPIAGKHAAPPKPAVKPVAKVAAKVVKKVAPKAKSKGKTKPKPKTMPKKKSSAKPAKKKSRK